MAYAFVVSKYNPDYLTGAEYLVSNLAKHLSKRGYCTTLLTTCIWEDDESYFNEGESRHSGVKIIRFPTDQRNLALWNNIQSKIYRNQLVSVEEQLTWLENSVNSRALYQYLVENHESFKAIFFAPYLLASSFWGSQTCPSKAFLIPCLHDESYAYLESTEFLFRRVKGVLFNTDAEKNLARRLYGEIKGRTVGIGLDAPQPNVSLAPFFNDSFPYLLYMGRKVEGKNLHALMRGFKAYKEKYGTSLKLVLAGTGALETIDCPDLIQLGAVSDQEKQSLLKFAAALCQPSLKESFSLVLMEAWLQDTPVLVHANNLVTREHVSQSNGGLYFQDERDFCGAIHYLLSNHEVAKGFGRAGREYVKSRYNWHRVIDNFEFAMETLI